MFCNRCGNEINDDSEFCSKCGTKLKQNSKIETKKKKETSKSTKIFIIVLLSIIILYFSIMTIMNISNISQKIVEGNIEYCTFMGFWLIIVFLCGCGISKNVSKLRGKEFTAEQLKRKKIRNIIISGIIIFAMAVLAFILPMLNNKNNLQYNTKYVYEDNYITFFEDGTYARNVEGITTANYTFNNETKEIICKEIQNVDGYEMDLEIFFKYLNENEIQKTSMKVLGSVPNGVEFGEIYSTGNTLKEKQENKTEKQEIVKDTRMLHEEDNYEYIGFSSNGLKRMLLAFYEDGRLGIRTYTLNKYNGNYEQVGAIQWGTYQVKHNVIYAGNTMMTITSPDEVSKVQLFKYNGMEFTAIEVNNDNINVDLDTLNNSNTDETETTTIQEAETNDNSDDIDREELLENFNFCNMRGFYEFTEKELQELETYSNTELKAKWDKISKIVETQDKYDTKYREQLNEIFKKTIKVELNNSEDNHYTYTPSNKVQPKSRVEYVAINENGIKAIYYSVEMTLTITDKQQNKTEEITTKKYYKTTNIDELDNIIKINNYDTQAIKDEIDTAIAITEKPIETYHLSGLPYTFYYVGEYVLYYLDDEQLNRLQDNQ